MPTAFITGASRGIGRGIALGLARAGHDIAALATKADPANTETGLYEVKTQVEALGRRFMPVLGDVADLDAHARIVDEAVAGLGGIDLFVSNAGVAPLKRMDILDTTPESFDRVLDINLRGAFFLAQRVALHLVARVNGGETTAPRMVFITSISADTASPNRAEYCISKAGLAMTAQNFAVRLAEYGIHVYDIRPGITATDMTAAVKERYDQLIEEEGLLLQPRWGTPDDVSKAVVGIAQGAFDYSTGLVIEVAGGFGIKRL